MPRERTTQRMVLCALVVVGVLLGSGVSSGAAVASSRVMNVSQIARGDYRSLTGRWGEAASGGNCYCGKGIQLHRGGADKLSVTRTTIVNGHIVLKGKRLSDGQGLKNARVVFARHGKYLTADLANQNVAINYTFSFYPRGVAMTGYPTTSGVTVSKSTNRIVIWTSNDSYTEVFAEK